MKKIFAVLIVSLVMLFGMQSFAQPPGACANDFTIDNIAPSVLDDLFAGPSLNAALYELEYVTIRHESPGQPGFAIGPQMTYPCLYSYYNGAVESQSIADLTTSLTYENTWGVDTPDISDKWSGIDFRKFLTVAALEAISGSGWDIGVYHYANGRQDNPWTKMIAFISAP